jgi:hypothetical protein
MAAPDSRAMATTTCPTSGLTIPECSCTGCLTDQVRRFRPQLLQNGKTGDRKSESVR